MSAGLTVYDQLLDDILQYATDPAGFVCYVFPWGEPGTPLEHEDGPDTWQLEVLDYIGQQVATSTDAIRVAVVSGHGVGKSALMCWLILWMMSTKNDPQIPITASTGTQLSTKTWRELAYWHNMLLNKDWFTWTATKFYHKLFSETWYASAIPWSKEKAQSFAGAHAEHVFVGFDEASTIDDDIWEVVEGAMSTPGAIWFVEGNPEKNSGRFHACFHAFRGLWKTFVVDSLSAKKTNKSEIQRQIAAYGVDSDFVRVRWLGKFPRQAPMQFISEALVEQAQSRQPMGYAVAPKVLGVDVARFGDDETVLLLRQGTAIHWIKGYRGLSTDQVTDLVADALLHDQGIVQAFVDVVGVGAGVVDQLNRLNFRHRVQGVNTGEASSVLYPDTQTKKYFNLRAQVWGLCKEWLEQGGGLPAGTTEEGQKLARDLVAPMFGYAREQQIQLERKEDMKARGLASPDYGDALTLTFAKPVHPPLPGGAQRFALGMPHGRQASGVGRQ